MFFKDFVSVKRQKIKRGASQTYDTPSKKQNISLPSCDYVVSKKECYLVSFYYHVDDDQACLLIWRFFLDLVLFP